MSEIFTCDVAECNWIENTRMNAGHVREFCTACGAERELYESVGASGAHYITASGSDGLDNDVVIGSNPSWRNPNTPVQQWDDLIEQFSSEQIKAAFALADSILSDNIRETEMNRLAKMIKGEW